MRLLATATTALCLLSADAIADPAGKYDVAGTNPGNQSATYSGTVDVKRTGDTFQVLWLIGSQLFSGTGVITSNLFAVSYRSMKLNGVAVYTLQPDGSWDGVWTFDGGTTIGTERWSPQ